MKVLTKESFSRALRVLRRQSGMRQAEVGKRIDTTGATISRWEAGQVIPPDVQIKRLAEVFGVDADIFRIEDDPTGKAELLAHIAELRASLQEALALCAKLAGIVPNADTESIDKVRKLGKEMLDRLAFGFTPDPLASALVKLDPRARARVKKMIEAELIIGTTDEELSKEDKKPPDQKK